jgi:hypothetical protein
MNPVAAMHGIRDRAIGDECDGAAATAISVETSMVEIFGIRMFLVEFA